MNLNKHIFHWNCKSEWFNGINKVCEFFHRYFTISCGYREKKGCHGKFMFLIWLQLKQFFPLIRIQIIGSFVMFFYAKIPYLILIRHKYCALEIILSKWMKLKNNPVICMYLHHCTGVIHLKQNGLVDSMVLGFGRSSFVQSFC